MNCRTLEELRVSRYISEKDQLDDDDVVFMMNNVAQQLTTLILDGATLTDISFQSILQCEKLKKLGIYGATSLSGRIFSQLWKHFPNLTNLKIKQAHQVNGENVKSLFIEGKEVMKNLVQLDLTGCWKVRLKFKLIESIKICHLFSICLIFHIITSLTNTKNNSQLFFFVI